MATNDLIYMKMTLSLAETAARAGEVPVGALIVKDDEVIASAYNLRETLQSPTAHAEMLAIERASKRLGSWRLLGCTLYVSLEPCYMCAGALVQARIQRVVYAAKDPKAGALGSLYSLADDVRLNHRFAVTDGLYAEESARQLKQFFATRRLDRG